MLVDWWDLLRSRVSREGDGGARRFGCAGCECSGFNVVLVCRSSAGVGARFCY